MSTPQVTTVIIPTLGHRPLETRRAIASVLGQVGDPAIPLVILNGQRFDPAFVAELESRRDIRFLRTTGRGVSNARLVGIDSVDTPLFSFLDDDDEYLPNATLVRNPAFLHEGADMVVTSGWRQRGEERIRSADFSHHTDDPARDLLIANWMHSAGASFRTATVARSFFENLGDLLEITRLTLRISLRLRVVRIDEPTFVGYETAIDRASVSKAYLDAIPSVLQHMHDETDRRELRTMLARLRSDALHTCSAAALEAGDLRSAWALHLASLTTLSGLRYLMYSRHLLGRWMFNG